MQQQKKISNYVLDLTQCLGKGTFGKVFFAIDVNTQQAVAVKQIHINKSGEELEKFFHQIDNEIQMMKAVNHPNIVRLIDIVKTSNNLYMIMEYCKEGSLETYIHKKNLNSKLKTLSEQESVFIFEKIVLAYKQLLKSKIIHRDIKQANILIDDGEPKLADFGFSRVIEFGLDDPLLQTYAGSPLYMSKQMLKRQNYSTKTDIWSLAVVLYEMLYGDTPWIGKTINDLIHNIENLPLKFPSNIYVSKITKSLLSKMLVVDEDQRISWDQLFQHDFQNHYQQISTFNTFLTPQINNNDNNDQFAEQIQTQNQYFIENGLSNGLKQGNNKRRSSNLFQNQGQKSTQSFFASLFSRTEQKSRSNSPQNRSASPLISKDQLQQDPTGSIAKILIKNQNKLNDKQIVNTIEDYIIFKRNKAIFLNNLALKWYDLSQKKTLGNLLSRQTYLKVLFVLTKFQYKIFMVLNSHLQQKTFAGKRFTTNQWAVYYKSDQFRNTKQQIKKDNQIVRPFLIDLIDNVQEVLLEQSYDSQDVLAICHEKGDNKQFFYTIYQRNIFAAVQIIKQFLSKEMTKGNEVLMKDILVLGIHMQNALKIKEKFRYRLGIDFFKYYESIEHENPIILSEILGVFKQ